MIDTELQRNAKSARDRTQLTVLNPMGYPPRVTPKDLAPRLDTLEGKGPWPENRHPIDYLDELSGKLQAIADLDPISEDWQSAWHGRCGKRRS